MLSRVKTALRNTGSETIFKKQNNNTHPLDMILSLKKAQAKRQLGCYDPDFFCSEQNWIRQGDGSEGSFVGLKKTQQRKDTSTHANKNYTYSVPFTIIQNRPCDFWRQKRSPEHIAQWYGPVHNRGSTIQTLSLFWRQHL